MKFYFRELSTYLFQPSNLLLHPVLSHPADKTIIKSKNVSDKSGKSIESNLKCLYSKMNVDEMDLDDLINDPFLVQIESNWQHLRVIFQRDSF